MSVSGACGTPVQKCATVTATNDVGATPLTNATRCEGVTHQFCTTASGTGPFTYSWTKNAVAIPGATDSCYTATAAAGGGVDSYCVTVTGACGSIQRCGTLTANLNVNTTALTPGTVCVGLTFQFCTTASGTGPFTYAWKKNGNTIAGATNSCYTATASSTGGTVHTYCVTVSGACGAPVERCATLTASGNTTASNLNNASVCAGATHQFCTTAGGAGPFTYSWTRNGTAIPGATNSCYTATAGSSGTAATYCVTVTGSCGSDCECATLCATSNVNASNLCSATVCAGATNQFCTTASGTGPFTYLWKKNGNTIGGATSSCYTATAGSNGTVDTYCVTVTGGCGSDTECATLTGTNNVTASPLTSANVCPGSTHQFCTTAGGTGPFTYLWKKNGTTISGATGSCYTATASSTGGVVQTYCVTVTGNCGSDTECGTLTAKQPTTATSLTDATGCYGATHQFCTTAGGAGPFTYAWKKDGATISGATGSCYTATVGNNPHTYCVTVTGACGSVQRCAVLCKSTGVSTTDLCDDSGCVGEPVTFCTTTTGTGPFTYRWYRNGCLVPGETTSCYSFDLAWGDDEVCVTVSGACGSCVTRCANLCVQSCGARHLTLTQGAYGNCNGGFNGVNRLALIQTLLQGGMRVGVLNARSLYFQASSHDAQCIIDRMPSSGSAATLPNFGNETLDSNCQTSPTAIPLQNGRFQNILLGQVTALSLNVRLSDGITYPNGCDTIDTDLWNQTICRSMVSRRLLDGPDGCRGTADDVPDMGAPLATVSITSSVMNALSSLSLPQTVGGLLALGNRALAGQSLGGASLSDISSAVDSINILFDEGRELLSCTNP